MSESELSGEEMMRQNMAAFEGGDELPHEDSDGNQEPAAELDDSDGGEEHSAEIDSQQYDDEPIEDEPADDARHMSREDWVASGKDADDYLTPDEFKRAGALRNESTLSLAKKFAQQESMMQEIIAGQNKALEENSRREREKVIAELRTQQAEAIEFSDADKAAKLEREIANHEAPEKPADNSPQVDAGVQEWHAKNKDWFGVHSEATGMLNVELKRAQGQNLPFADAIGPAMDKVKRQFNYLFDDAPAATPAKEKTLKPRPRAVSDKSRSATKPQAKKRSFTELDQSMQGFARRAAKAANMTEQQYMEQM